MLDNTTAPAGWFVNTTNAPVTLGSVTIQPGSINLDCGRRRRRSGNRQRHGPDVCDGPGCGSPTGAVAHLTAPFIGWIRAVNVGTQDFKIFNQTISPGKIKNIYQINRPEFRAIVVNAAREFFYIGNAPNSSTRVVFKLDSNANSGNGIESIYAGGGNPDQQ